MGDSGEQRPFDVSGAAYDRFMGRYSRPLAAAFAEFAGVRSGQRVLDVGCGPGALTSELVSRVGATSVSAVDPSSPFVDACAARHPEVDVRLGGPGEIVEALDVGGFVDITEHELVVTSQYADFDELWHSLLGGAGPVGAYCVSLSPADRAAVHDELYDRLDEPTGSFVLEAAAFAARGRRPETAVHG